MWYEVLKIGSSLFGSYNDSNAKQFYNYEGPFSRKLSQLYSSIKNLIGCRLWVGLTLP